MKQSAVVAMLATLAMGAQFPRNGGHIHRHKRQDVIVTVTSEVIVTDIETVWVTAGQDSTPQTSAVVTHPASVIQPSIVVPSSSQPPAQQQNSQKELPTSAPAPPATSAQAPASSAQAPASSAQAPAPASSAPSGGSGTGQVYTGEATWYMPAGGYGSCGGVLQNGDHTVALSADAFMNAGKAKYCGKTIEITGPKGKFSATVADTCPGCTDAGHLDLPGDFYVEVTGDTDDINTSKGHMPISWQFTD